jgi:formylmethanofuran dehydrogenase subunit E
MNFIDVIAELRGGIPASCDFCSEPFTKENYATPEELGEWACIQCVNKWDDESEENNT